MKSFRVFLDSSALKMAVQRRIVGHPHRKTVDWGGRAVVADIVQFTTEDPTATCHRVQRREARRRHKEARKAEFAKWREEDEALETEDWKPGGRSWRFVVDYAEGVAGELLAAAEFAKLGKSGKNLVNPAAARYKRLVKSLGGGYTVRANIGVSGKAYRKFGTAFETRILVIDRTPAPEGHKPVFATAETLEDCIIRLEEVRNAPRSGLPTGRHGPRPWTRYLRRRRCRRREGR